MRYYYKEPGSKAERKISKSMIKTLAFSKNSPLNVVRLALSGKGVYNFADGSSIYVKEK